MKKREKIIFDMLLNIVATAIPILFLQLILLPVLARDMSDAEYGLLLTIVALFDMAPAAMGNVLNNIRLLYQNDYSEKNLEGDFNILLLLLMAINVIIVGCITYSYDHKVTFLSFVLTILVSVLWLAKEYFIVAFRLKINYAAILFNNVLQAAGYAFGYLLFHFTGLWQFIYLTGSVFSIAYIFTHCTIWKERFQITPLFRATSRQGSLLLISNLLNRMLTYADRLLIYPILGGTAVSVYYAASVFGKVISLMITPVNSVVLTYLSKVKNRQDTMFKTALLMGTIACIFGYAFCILISRPILGILYPQYVSEAMRYLLLTTGTAVLYAMISIINPFILKFFNMKWQIIINGGTVIVYVVLCMGFVHFYGLFGFCCGTLITNFMKLIFMMIIYKRETDAKLI